MGTTFQGSEDFKNACQNTCAFWRGRVSEGAGEWRVAWWTIYLHMLQVRDSLNGNFSFGDARLVWGEVLECWSSAFKMKYTSVSQRTGLKFYEVTSIAFYFWLQRMLNKTLSQCQNMWIKDFLKSHIDYLMPWGGKSNHNCFLSLIQLVFKMKINQTKVCVVHMSVGIFRWFLDRNTIL